MRYLPLNGEGMTAVLRNVIPFLNLALAGFVLASIAARFVFPSISLEGRTWWLLRSSPLPMREVLWAKFWVGAVPLLVLAAVLVGLHKPVPRAMYVRWHWGNIRDCSM